ncbi:MAG TPA: ABC transporter ATP-binding protein [Candidatus Dormibacteraeota bacterium]|nr:ABC transporter ATP-binding protein [Candidatus Dormibacteraeota bacterium]
MNGHDADGGEAAVFEEVVKRYGQVVALDRLGFRVERGEVVALLGPNGAGKSTAVDILLGLRAPDSGRVRVLGVPPARAVASGRVGGMLQRGGLPAGARVGEVLDLARALYPEARGREELLDLADLAGLTGRRVETLSGGQAQRLRFALALAGRPRLLFLDEPTVGLDVEVRRHFWAIVRAVAADGTGVLFTTHYLEEADANADRVLVLDRGRLLRQGTPSAVRAAASARVVRCTLAGATPDRLRRLPGVVDVVVHGDDVTIRSTDADRTVGALYALGSEVRDLLVTGAGLEDAFLVLTRGEAPVGEGDRR